MKTDINNNLIKNKINNIISKHGAAILVNKNKILKNSDIILKKINNSIVAPVIKSEGYGVGSILLTNILYECNYKDFFTGNVHEAINLRKKFKHINIYVLNCGIPLNILLIKKYNLIPVLNDISEVKFWVKKIKKKNPCIIHIDTGMNRLGINIEDIKNIENKIFFKKLNIKFMMSHLACAEDQYNIMNKKQLNTFQKANILLSKITKENIKSSICNSSGIWLGKKYHMDIVRPGAAFLGINPTKNTKNFLNEPLELITQVYQVREIDKGSTVGYGASFKANKKSKLATISIGYSYGLSRLLSNIGSVFIEGIEVKIVGRISMDLTVIDISKFKNNDIKPGQIVEVFGKNRSLENFSKKNNTIPYEIICKMARNIPKILI
tara:strand:+ start:58 stop:1197 length:1140 start_codon:yes stop_codon:yes gene_type:complete